MQHDRSIRRYRTWYATLVRLYPKPYRECFGEGMEQTFGDMLRERQGASRELLGFALWIFVETFAGIIREHLTRISMQTTIKRLSIWAVLVVAILMIPLLAQWPWTRGDFVFAVVVLFGSALLYELIARTSGNAAYRFAVGMAVAAMLLLAWVNGAVGIIGGSDVNVLYAGVIFTLFIGAIIARLKPRGMSYVLFAAALVQFAIPVIALIIGTPDFAPGVVRVFTLNTFWVMAFVGSALLFRQASAANSRPTA
ncbi:hypothetical protein C4552_03555 [Candidatus Parcubacteria bacterium]|nr:MAG: hypothetical protein C4552_03555 [Candidatus Parcubacteria bacterium]